MSTHLLSFGLGRGIAELGSGFPPPKDVPSMAEIIGPGSTCFTTATLIEQNPTAFGSGAWLVANNPFAMPFYLSSPATAFQIGWSNGSSAGDNADVGIYDSTFTKIVSSGSTAASGSSSVQFVDIADTALAANTLYYLVLIRDTTTANRQRRWSYGANTIFQALGCYSSADALFPLPSTLTNMVLATASWTTAPAAYIALRALV